jgi:hypothetical protein
MVMDDDGAMVELEVEIGGGVVVEVYDRVEPIKGSALQNYSDTANAKTNQKNNI